MNQEDQDGTPAWPRWGVPIRDMTTGQLAAVVAYLNAGARLDEVLIRAVQTELTFRQAGIRPEPQPLAVVETGPRAATLEE